MFSNHITKSVVVLAMIAAFFAGCRRVRDSGETDARPVLVPTIDRIPFSTREPDTFQAEIVVTSGDTVSSTFIARSGERRRVEFDSGKRSRLAYVLNEKAFLILPERSKFSEVPPGSPFSTDDWSAFLTDRWLSETTDATFEKLETSGSAVRYRAKMGGAGKSEAIITVDESTGIPIRQEFYSIADGVPTLTMTFEVRNLKLSADDSLFSVPNGFVKVERSELLKLKLSIENE